MAQKVSVNQEVNEIFAPLWIESDWRYALLMGGRGAGRSTAGSQFDLSHLLAPNYFRGAIMRAVHSDIRSSIYRDLCDRIDEQNIREAVHIKDNDMSFQYGSNTINSHGFKASSGSQTAKLKSLANYNNVRVEEAEEIGEEEFKTLDDSLRTTKGDIHITLQLNPPPKSHWIVQRFFDLEEHPKWPGFYIPHAKTNTEDEFIYIGGTYLDNVANLDDNTIRRYKAYEKNDPDYYCRRILGLVADEVRGKIYRGWNRVSKLPKEASLVAIGVDWGWWPDPAAVEAIYYCSGEYFVVEVIVSTEIDDEAMAGFIKQVPGWERVPTVCGSDEPKAIQTLKKHGVKRATKGVSGQGSVDYRIKAISSKKISVVVDTSAEKSFEGKYPGEKTWEAYEVYHWAEDKDGNQKGEPDHEGSDPMDAIGYGIGYLVDPEKRGGGVNINKPNFKSYGKSNSPGSSGSKVSVHIPGRNS